MPAEPSVPVRTLFDNTKITLYLPISQNDMGSPITSYHLYINQGSYLSPFHEVTAYDGYSQTYTFNVGDLINSLPLTVGKTYAFKYSASNSIGEGLPSDELYVALARKQGKPQPVTFNQARSNRFKNVV